MACIGCKYARKAENVEYVGCVRFFDEFESSCSSDNIPDRIFELYDVDKIQTGWVRLGVYPEKEPDGTLRNGLITNGIICFPKIFKCNNFVEREDI